MLRSHGISQIYHTYSEDMHSCISSATVVTPRCNRRVCKGAYPPRRCGISYTYAEGSVLLISVYFIIVNAISMNRTSIIQTPLIVQSQVLL